MIKLKKVSLFLCCCFILLFFVVGVDRVSADQKACVEYKYNECPVNCAKNDDYKFCSPNGLAYLSCGDARDIPPIAPKLVSYTVTLLKTVAPIVLIIISIVTLVKSITAGKEDEIKKAQNSLVKRIIMAAFVFFTITIVQFIMLKIAGDEKDNLSSCLSCFLNGTDDCGSIYYKDGKGKCIYLDGSSKYCD